MIINGVMQPGVTMIEEQIAEHESNIRALEQGLADPEIQIRLAMSPPATRRIMEEPIHWSRNKVRELRQIAVIQWQAHLDYKPEPRPELEANTYDFHLDPDPYWRREAIEARIEKHQKALAAEDAEAAEMAYLEQLVEDGSAYAYADQDPRWQ